MIIPGGIWGSEGAASPRGSWSGSYFSSMQLPYRSNPRGWLQMMGMLGMVSSGATFARLAGRSAVSGVVRAAPVVSSTGQYTFGAIGSMIPVGDLAVMYYAKKHAWKRVLAGSIAGTGMAYFVYAHTTWKNRRKIGDLLSEAHGEGNQLIPIDWIDFEGVPLSIDPSTGDLYPDLTRVSFEQAWDRITGQRSKFKSGLGASKSSQRKRIRPGKSAPPYCHVHKKRHWCPITRGNRR